MSPFYLDDAGLTISVWVSASSFGGARIVDLGTGASGSRSASQPSVVLALAQTAAAPIIQARRRERAS